MNEIIPLNHKRPCLACGEIVITSQPEKHFSCLKEECLTSPAVQFVVIRQNKIEEAIRLIEPYIEEETFPEDDQEMWKGVLHGLKYAINDNALLERALIPLRSADTTSASLVVFRTNET